MAFSDMLNLYSAVTVVKTISTSDNMGGYSVTASSSVIPLCAIWQTGSSNRWLSDMVYKGSSDVLCYPYGGYTFDVAVTDASIIETVTYSGRTYKRVGLASNVMEKNEIVVQGLERLN